MKLSDTALNIQPSLLRELFNRAQKYSNVIGLTLGDPDFNTPLKIKNAGINAIYQNRTHYFANAGTSEARQTFIKYIEEIWGIKGDPDKNALIIIGGMEALYLSLLSLINLGDEIIIFAPYYVN